MRPGGGPAGGALENGVSSALPPGSRRPGSSLPSCANLPTCTAGKAASSTPVAAPPWFRREVRKLLGGGALMLVGHVTTVVPDHDLTQERALALGEALGDLGFEADGPSSWRSAAVEAAAAKAYLRGRGFADREFRIVLEYEPRWGMM